MKKIIIIQLTLLFFASCTSHSYTKADLKNDSLTSVVNDRDSSLSDFVNAFNQIESNLDSVAAKQQIIYLYSGKKHPELAGNRKAHINAEIAAINDLMVKNRKEIEDMENKLKGSNHNNALLAKTIKTLTIQLSQKDYELCELNLEMKAMNVKVGKLLTNVDSLSKENYMKEVIIDFQTSDLHNAYYIVADGKYLKDEKIIDKKGGLLGIGRTAKLSDDFDDRLFTQINYTRTTTIPINGYDVKMITNHPSDSYKFEMDGTQTGVTKNLVILFPEKFWSVSKYLVISRKQ